jgi:DNA-directed RNA polymerase subunit RPC12/RpoP
MSTVREEWGLSCPKCGSDERLEVELTTMAKLTPDGTDPIGDQLWDETSYTRCDACGHDGKLARFHLDDEMQK